MTQAGLSGGRLKGLVASATMVAAIVIAPSAWAQAPAAKGAPPKAAIPPELRAALEKADAGDTKPLLKLADGGAADAQYYAGRMYIAGRAKVPADPARGCGYVERASAKRADAMYMVGVCHQYGMVTGKPDATKAKAAFNSAIKMGDPNARCALGELLIGEPGQAERGMDLCKSAGKAGDVDAQMRVAGHYMRGGPIKADHKEARRWYEMASKQGSLDAMRVLGQMYATGDGGSRDPKKAVALWTAGDKAGDPLVAILMADHLFSSVTGGKTPGPGTYAFRGGIPVSEIEIIEEWYRDALKRDPRPDVKKRAESAIKVLASFKKAAKAGG